MKVVPRKLILCKFVSRQVISWPVHESCSQKGNFMQSCSQMGNFIESCSQMGNFIESCSQTGNFVESCSQPNFILWPVSDFIHVGCSQLR